MRLPNAENVHLTYCLNIHRGETWEENFAAVRDKALAVKKLVCPGKPFGLGMRLSNAASLQLAEPKALADFRAFLDANGLYVFTINGFPYGGFHDGIVKDNVYRPDWSDPKRLAYTNRLADILAALLPEGASGSISTVPLSYKKWFEGLSLFQLSRKTAASLWDNVADCAWHLAEIRRRTGKHIALALEPEPDCLIETTEEAELLRAFLRSCAGVLQGKRPVSPEIALDIMLRHVGVCVDLCHLSVEFEDPAASIAQLAKAGVVIPKVQISAALALTPTRTARRKLAEFADPVYLHQVKVRKANGEIVSYADLDQAPEVRTADGPPGEEWRVHFHVPLYFSEYGELRSTRALYTPALAKLLTSGVTPHLEIETYTFDVLPPAARESDVVRSIAREFEWVLDWLTA